MPNIVVIGAQWGDEGKGRIVDLISENVDIIARYQGGNNAGHTVVFDGETYKLSLLPAGVLHPGKLSVIANGVVFNPKAFFEELDRITARRGPVGGESARGAWRRFPKPGFRRQPGVCGGGARQFWLKLSRRSESRPSGSFR